MTKNITALEAKIKDLQETIETFRENMQQLEDRMSGLEQTSFERENNVHGFEGQDD